MEDIKRKNEQLESLLAENQSLKQHTQVQEKQVAKLEQELKGDDWFCCALLARIKVALHIIIIVKAKVMMNLHFDLERKFNVGKRQSTKQVKHAQTQSDILFPISGQSSV